MPDLISIFARRWKLIVGITALAAIIAYILCLFAPKEYLSTATALPANSMIADKARLFNKSIDQLYSDFGTPDELDKLEGTASLDTVFIAVANKYNLPGHYLLEGSPEGMYKAAMKLKKNSKTSRSAYGELKVKVWDVDRNMAAELANSLMSGIAAMHQHMQNENNAQALHQIKLMYAAKQAAYKNISDTLAVASGSNADLLQAKKTALLAQLQEYEKMMDEYDLAIKTNPEVLLSVENARASLWPDKPNIPLTVGLTLFTAFVFTFLLAVYAESRKRIV